MTSDPVAGDYTSWKGWAPEGFGVEGRGDRPYYKRELRELMGADTQQVLEIGFGNGVVLAFGRARGWTMTGTELQPELVATANRRGFDAHDSATVDRLPDAGFDGIIALDVFEHISPDESIDFLTVLGRKLRVGGHIVLRFPNADSWLGNAFQNGDPTHVNAIGMVKMTYYARSAGLRIDSFRAAARRGFATSAVHGLHSMTAGNYLKLSAAVSKALHFPALPVVLSTSDVVCALTRDA
jgi:SAM-dependent methyltransferase